LGGRGENLFGKLPSSENPERKKIDHVLCKSGNAGGGRAAGKRGRGAGGQDVRMIVAKRCYDPKWGKTHKDEGAGRTGKGVAR